MAFPWMTYDCISSANQNCNSSTANQNTVLEISEVQYKGINTKTPCFYTQSAEISIKVIVLPLTSFTMHT